MTDQPIAKKSLGQHWLYDQTSLEAMCSSADVSEGDYVLEIGPGLGTLTTLLVKRAKQVLAVEYDKILAANLKARVKSNNLEVVNEDILSFDFTTLPKDYKIVANIPYYLTSHLLRKISESSNPPKSVALLTQKEVAERVVALPGDMSILSVTVQFYWQTSLGMVVPAKLFTPPPKIDSQILILTRRDQPLFKDIDEKAFFRVVKAGYAQKRKTLLNNLSSGLQLDRKVVTSLCESVDIDPGRRAQTLTLDEWYNLYISLNT